MKFVTFKHAGMTRAGVLDGDYVVDLAHAAMRSTLHGAEPQMLAFLDAGLANIVRDITAHGLADAAKLPLDKAILLAPLPLPRRIFGIAHNYRDALAERGMQPPSEPVLFMKTPRTIAAHEQAIVLPAGVGGVAYEAELAAVIGKRAEKVRKELALDHVAAYGCFNDISASEIIKADGHFDRERRTR